jgi:hypothetical protein
MNQGKKTGNGILISILALGALPRLAVAFLPVKTLIQYVIPDDSYYYFQIATNIGRGLGPTLDGVNLTNGFHPLWAYLITPVFWLKGVDPDLPIRIVVILSGLLDVLTAYVIYRVGLLLSDSRGGALLGAACYAAAPAIIARSVCGLEVALGLTLIALVTWQLARILEQDRWQLGDVALLGALCALMNLARSDTIYYTLAVGIIAFYYLYRRRKLRLFAPFVITALVLAAPWLIWNLAEFGTPVQVSAVAVPYVESPPGASRPIWDVVSRFSAIIRDFSGFTHFSSFAGLTLVPVGLAWGLIAAGPRERRGRLLVILALTCAAFVDFVVHTTVRQVTRDWYFSEFAIAASLAVGTAAALYPAPSRKKLIFILTFLAWLVAGLPFAVKRVVSPSYPWQTEMYRGAAWVNARPAIKVAAFNAGIISYYADNRITNVDGTVNNAAFDAIKNRELYKYVIERKIDYIVDYDKWVYRFYEDYWPRAYLSRIRRAADLDNPELKFGGRYGVHRIVPPDD